MSCGCPMKDRGLILGFDHKLCCKLQSRHLFPSHRVGTGGGLTVFSDSKVWLMRVEDLRVKRSPVDEEGVSQRGVIKISSHEPSGRSE